MNCEQWRRPGAEFGEWKKKNFRGPKFLNDFFGKKFHFHGQHFWWPFLVIDQVFRIFPFFSQIFPFFYYVQCVVYNPFVTRTIAISEKNSFMTPFFTLFVLLRASDNTTSQNIEGDGCMGRSPTSNFGGPSPQSPLGLRPCFWMPLLTASLILYSYNVKVLSQ